MFLWVGGASSRLNRMTRPSNLIYVLLVVLAGMSAITSELRPAAADEPAAAPAEEPKEPAEDVAEQGA